jgi:F-type H+-transporting ATPase subunit c
VGALGVIGYGLGVIGASIGIGLAAYGATTSMARQPEVQNRLFTVFILGSAFVEALALIGFVVALIVK